MDEYKFIHYYYDVILYYYPLLVIPNNNSTIENSMWGNDYVNQTMWKFAQLEYVSCGTLLDTWTRIGMQSVATIAVQQCPIILHILRSIFIFRYEQWTINVVYHSFDRFTFNRKTKIISLNWNWCDAKQWKKNEHMCLHVKYTKAVWMALTIPYSFSL